MPMNTHLRLAGAFALVIGLAGCVDATMEVEVLTEETARGTMTMTMDKEIYDMAAASDENDFCEDGEVELTETSAICTTVQEGPFEELAFDEDSGEDTLTFTSEGPGLVRVTFPTGTLSESMSEDMGGEEDPQAAAMMAAFFEGRFLTLRVSGGEITDTNMELADDGMSAELAIPFLDMINGEADLPDESYAVVRVD